MVSETATSLHDALTHKIQELGEALEQLDEESAAKRPSGNEWCCKEILSHLMGEEGESFLSGFQRFLDEDNPLIGIVSGLPYYTPERQAMSMKEMRGAVWAQYSELATFLGSLNEEQLKRKGRVPLLKDTPIGENPTLEQWAGALINFHLADHVQQIRNARPAS